MDEERANRVRRLSGAYPTGQGVHPPGLEDQEAGGTGSEMMRAERAYRLFLLERLCTWKEQEELRVYLRQKVQVHHQ